MAKEKNKKMGLAKGIQPLSLGKLFYPGWHWTFTNLE